MVQKELLIFALVLLVLSLGMHMNQWIAHPILHLQHLSEHKMPYHPLLYTFICYLAIGFFRLLIHFVSKIFRSH